MSVVVIAANKAWPTWPTHIQTRISTGFRPPFNHVFTKHSSLNEPKSEPARILNKTLGPSKRVRTFIDPLPCGSVFCPAGSDHGPLVWTPDLESLFTQYIPHRIPNEGPYFEPPHRKEVGEGPNKAPNVVLRPKFTNV